MENMDIKLKLLYEREIGELRGLLMDAIRYLQEPHSIDEMKGFSSLLYQRMEISKSVCCGFRKELEKQLVVEQERDIRTAEFIRQEELNMKQAELAWRAQLNLMKHQEAQKEAPIQAIKPDEAELSKAEAEMVLGDRFKLVHREEEIDSKAIGIIEMVFSGGHFGLKTQTCFGKLGFWKNQSDSIGRVFALMEAELTKLEKLCEFDNNPILAVKAYINGTKGIESWAAKNELARFAWSLGSIENSNGKELKEALSGFRADNYGNNRDIYKYVKESYEERRKRK